MAQQNEPATPDGRSFGQLIRQFREYEGIKAKLIRNGMLNGDATQEDVEIALRKCLPVEAFRKGTPGPAPRQ